MSEMETCQHLNERPCYRVFSNGTRHYGFQCVRCGRWMAVPKKDWERKYDPEKTGPYEPSIADEFWSERKKESQAQWEMTEKQRADDARINRETSMAEYYASDAWGTKRQLRMGLNTRLFGGWCEICFKERAVQCHHITYARFGAEWIFDLACLCTSCHAAQHPHMEDDGS